MNDTSNFLNIIILNSMYLTQNTKIVGCTFNVFWGAQVLGWYDHWMKTRKLSSRNLFKSTLKGICCTYGHIIMNQSQVNYHVQGWYYHLSIIFCSRSKLDYYHHSYIAIHIRPSNYITFTKYFSVFLSHISEFGSGFQRM